MTDLLLTVDAALDAHIPRISDADVRHEALVFLRGVKSIIELRQGLDGDTSSIPGVADPGVQQRIGNLIELLRVQQIDGATALVQERDRMLPLHARRDLAASSFSGSEKLRSDQHHVSETLAGMNEGGRVLTEYARRLLLLAVDPDVRRSASRKIT